MMRLSELRAANAARQAEWPGGNHIDLAFRGLELIGETGELEEAVMDLLGLCTATHKLANLLKKRVRQVRGIGGTKEGVSELMRLIADEAGDVLICLDLICMDLGIDLAPAVAAKFNATSEKHGLKTRLE